MALLVACALLIYVGYAALVGRVTLAPRWTPESTITAAAGWPFLLGLGIYAVGAGVFLWIARGLLRPSGKQA